MPETLSQYALTTKERMKAYLKISDSDTKQDDNIVLLINACTAAIESECRRKLKARNFTDEVYDGTGSVYLLLRNYPLNTLTSVTILDEHDAEEEVTVNRMDNEAGMLQYPSTGTYGRWPKGFANIKVSYNGGYATVPDDLELACKLLVEFYYKLSITDFSKVFGESGIVIRPEVFPGKVKRLIGPYRRYRV